MKGHTVVAREAERPSSGNVADLLEALKRSIEGSAPGKTKSVRGGKKRA
jgi:non-homologous end joining protein Ku